MPPFQKYVFKTVRPEQRASGNRYINFHCPLRTLYDTAVILTFTAPYAHTTHTVVVPFCVHGEGCKLREITHDPGLADVSPTVLAIMGLDQPPEMTGQSLLATPN